MQCLPLHPVVGRMATRTWAPPLGLLRSRGWRACRGCKATEDDSLVAAVLRPRGCSSGGPHQRSGSDGDRLQRSGDSSGDYSQCSLTPLASARGCGSGDVSTISQEGDPHSTRAFLYVLTPRQSLNAPPPSHAAAFLFKEGCRCGLTGMLRVSSPLLGALNHSRTPSPSPLFLRRDRRSFGTENIRGRLFYKRRPRQVPKMRPRRWRSKWLEGSPQKKGICTRVYVKTPKKPNSGLRKVARVRLSTGKHVMVYIPGVGHNLNVHSSVLVRGGRTHDIVGCNYKAIRGKYDLLPVQKKRVKRSKYGAKLGREQREERLESHNRPWVETTRDRRRFNRYIWPVWSDPETGAYRSGPLRDDEPLPPHLGFNSLYKAKVAKRSGGAS